MSKLNDLFNEKLGTPDPAAAPTIAPSQGLTKLGALLDSRLAGDTQQVTEDKIKTVHSVPVPPAEIQAINKAEQDLRQNTEYMQKSDSERWLADKAWPKEFLPLLDESGLEPTKPMSPNSLIEYKRPRTKGEIFEANLKRLPKDDPLRQKVDTIRTIQRQYQDALVKKGVIEKPHEYQGLWNEVKWVGKEFGKSIASGTLNVASGAAGSLASVSEGAIWNPETIEGYAQALYGLSNHEALAADQAKGISRIGGFIASSIGQALPYMAASTGATLLTGTPIAAFGVGFAVEGDNSYRFALENGASEEHAQMNRLIVGTINGAIESLQVSNIIDFGSSGKSGYRALLKAAQQGAWNDVKKIGKDLTYEQLEHVLRESLEEALQEAMTIGAEVTVTGELDPAKAGKRIGGSALGGGVVGLGFGLGGRASGAAMGSEPQYGSQTIKALYDKAVAKQTGPDADTAQPKPPLLGSPGTIDTSDLPPVPGASGDPDIIRNKLIEEYGEDKYDEVFFELAEDGENDRFNELDSQISELDQEGEYDSPEALKLRTEYENIVGDELKKRKTGKTVSDKKPTQTPAEQEVKAKKPKTETPSKARTGPMSAPESDQTTSQQPVQESENIEVSPKVEAGEELGTTKYEGKAYRVETGTKIKGTAADVVRYEQNELGNDLGVTEEQLAELEKRPASDLIWVTREKAEAARYAQDDLDTELTNSDLDAVTEVDVTNGKIIADIGPDGVLVLKTPSKPRSPFEATTTPDVATKDLSNEGEVVPISEIADPQLTGGFQQSTITRIEDNLDEWELVAEALPTKKNLRRLDKKYSAKGYKVFKNDAGNIVIAKPKAKKPEKSLEQLPADVVESIEDQSNEQKPDITGQTGKEGQPGISGIPSDRDTEGGSTSRTDQTESSVVRRRSGTTNKDVLEDESAVGDSVPTPGVSSPAVEVGPERTSDRAGESVQRDRSHEVVPTAPEPDGNAAAGPSLDENYDLRNVEPVLLTKGQRKSINEQVKEILKKDKITAEDRDVLRQYTGEGGLTSGTVEALNQHYTDYPTIRRIFNALDDAGFEYDNALEPSVGSGNFVGMRPGKKWATVDIDKTNHEVVKKLYPKGTHYHLSFEEYRQGGHDLIISNVPFAEKRGKGGLKNRPDIKMLHDFYFAHSLDLVKDNGIIAFITSAGTMDKLDSTTRKEVVSKGDIIGAFRLPQGHFQKTAHTEVITDVIFIQKRPEGAVPSEEQAAINDAWTKVIQDDNGLKKNEYYDMFPEKILGNVEIGKDKLHGGKQIYVVTGQARLDEMQINYKPYSKSATQVEQQEGETIPTDSKEFEKWAAKNNIYYRQQSREGAEYNQNIIINDPEVLVLDKEIVFTDINDKVKTFKPIATSEARKALHLQRIGKEAEMFQVTGDQKYADHGMELIVFYRKEHKTHPSKDKFLKRLFKNNNEETYLLELSSFFDKNWNPAEVFTGKVKHTGSGKSSVTRQSSLLDRAFASENNKGVIVLSKSEYLDRDEIPKLLENGYSLVEYSEDDATLQNDILYYSGNVYEKISQAKVLQVKIEDKLLPHVEGQIDKLEHIKPSSKTLPEINFHGTENWILPHIKDRFWIRKVTVHTQQGDVIKWESFDKILSKHLNHYALTSRKSFEVGGVRIDEPMFEYMARLAQVEEHLASKLDQIKNYILDNPEMLKQVEHDYNAKFRNYVRPNYAKARYLVADAIDEAERNSGLTLRRNQVEWIVQAVYEGKGINAHDVGGGKTFAAIVLARALKLHGIAKKPIYVVPAKTIKSWKRDIKKVYPDAKVVDLGSLSKNKRTQALFDLANANADYVLISHEGFTNVKLPLEAEMGYIDDVLTEHLDDPNAKGRQKALLQQKIDQYKKLLSNENRDTRLTFDKLGIDMIIADEAHNYKNIGIRNELVKFGLGVNFAINQNKTTGDLSLKSARSYDFRFKANYIVQNNNGNNVFLLTATPTPNKPIEIYTMLRHLDPNIFAEYGIDTDKDFADAFFKLGTVENPNTGKPKQILKAIVNAQELRGILNQFVDKISMEEMPWIKIPKEVTQEHFLDQTDEYALIAEDLEERRKHLVKPPRAGDDTLVSIYTTTRSASVDQRLYGGDHAGIAIDERTHNVKDDKLELTINLVIDVHKKNKNAGQLIFLDAAGHSQVERGLLAEDLHREIKRELVAKGFKENQIAIINGKVVTNPKTGKESTSGDKDQKKIDITDAYNEGKIKVIIGSTTSMGEGMNLQIKTTDVYHLDIPYTPGAFKQRNGRGVRYGNENDKVIVHYMFMQGTFDSLSFDIVSNKRGWNEAIWDKETADEISTEEEMTAGVMPKREQIMIALESDPRKKQVLIRTFELSHMQDNRVVLSQMGRMMNNRIRRERDQLALRKEMLSIQRDKLNNLIPNEKFKDDAERAEHFEKSKKVLQNSIIISERKLTEIEQEIIKLQERKKQIDAEEAELSEKVRLFQEKYLNEQGEIVIPEDEVPIEKNADKLQEMIDTAIEKQGISPRYGDTDPTTDTESPMGGFVGDRPASVKLSAIVNEDMSTGSKNADNFLGRTKGFTGTGRPGQYKSLVDHIINTFREFHYLPYLPKQKEFAEIREHFRHTEEISRLATDYAVTKMKWALEPIKGVKRELHKRMKALEMKLIADDLAEDVEKGMELPPDMTAADVMIMQSRAQELYDKYPSVRQAYDRLRSITVEIGDMLVEEGMLKKDQAREFYFPHKVIKYLRNEDGFFGLPSRKPADYKKGYLKERKGGHDYSTDIMERLVEHWAQVWRDVEYRRFLEKVLKEEQTNYFKKEYPEWTEFTTDEDGKRVRNMVPEGYREVTVLPGRYYYQTNGVTEDMAKALMEQDLNSIEEMFDDNIAVQVRKVLALGKKRSYIVREPIAKQIHNMPTQAISRNPAYLFVKGFNTIVKGQILFNPLYAVPFHLTNFIGDAHKVLVALPGALKARHLNNYWRQVIAAHGGQASERFEQARQFGVIGSGWIGVDIPQLKTIMPEIERAEISGASKFALNKIERAWNIVKKAGAGREDWLRYALFDHLMDLQEQGKDISKYAIKDSHMISAISDPAMRAAKVARDIAGDYAAIGKTGRILSDVAIPFFRWMHLNLPWWPRMIKEYAKKGQAGRMAAAVMTAAAPYVLATLWNYSDDDRRKFEKSLPYWMRWNFHIVGLHGKKMYYVPLPLDDVLDFIGAADDILDFQRYQRGMIQMPELLKRIAINSTYEPGMSIVNAVGGFAAVAKDLVGVQTYPDIKPWLVSDWGRKGLNVAGDIFGAPAQVGKALQWEGVTDPKTGEFRLGPKTKDTLNRAWMGIRPYSVDIGRVLEQKHDATYQKANLKYKTTEGKREPHVKGRAHKGKQREVDSYKIQLEGKSK